MKKLNKKKKKNNSILNKLYIYKSNKNIYCQLYSLLGDSVITSVSSLDSNFKDYFFLNFGFMSKISLCAFLGKLIAIKSISLGIFKIFFDRNIYKYHGCVKVLAIYARKFGLIF